MLKFSKLLMRSSYDDASPYAPSPLDSVQVLIARDMGTGLVSRLQARNINALITNEPNPDYAVKGFLNGTLKTESLEPHKHGHKYKHK